MAASIAPAALAATGPQNANMQVPRTPIPVPAGMTARALGSAHLTGAGPDYAAPIVAPTPVLVGRETYTSFRDWYFRIHVVPAVLSLGNLTGDQTRPAMVWNAFLSPVDLEAFSLANADGITAVQPVTPPTSIGPLQVLNYTLQISATGPAVINATATWTIDGVDYVVPITGRRSVLFSFQPTWDQRVSETLEWKTSVVRSRTGKEQRNRLTRAPRRRLSYTVRELDGLRRQYLDSLLFGWQGRVYSLPIWNEVRWTTLETPVNTSTVMVDTSLMSIKPGSTAVLFRTPVDYEVVEIASVAADRVGVVGVVARAWPARTKLIPLAPAMPARQVGTRRPLPSVLEARFDFLIDPSAGLNRIVAGTPEGEYRGTETWFVETDWSSDLDVPIEANRMELDSGLGPVSLVRNGEFAFWGRSWRAVASSRTAADRLRRFFARREGRFQEVWMPSGTEDFTLLAPIDATSNSMLVADNQYSGFVAQQPIRRDIVLLMRDGRRLMRRITDSAPTDGGQVLVLDSAFGEVIDPRAVKRVSYLGLYRLSEDIVTFNWVTDEHAVVEVDFVLTEPQE